MMPRAWARARRPPQRASSRPRPAPAAALPTFRAMAHPPALRRARHPHNFLNLQSQAAPRRLLRLRGGRAPTRPGRLEGAGTVLPADLPLPDGAPLRSRVSGGRAPRPSGCAQVCSNAFVWWSPPPPAGCPQKAPTPGPSLQPPAEPGFRNPGARGGEGARPTPARRRPRGHLRVGARPDYLSPCPGAAGVLRLLSRCPFPRPGAAARPATPCPAATRRAERTGRAGMETRWLARSERWTRGCLGCAPTAAASYPRARRRQAGPRGLRAGL